MGGYQPRVMNNARDYYIDEAYLFAKSSAVIPMEIRACESVKPALIILQAMKIITEFLVANIRELFPISTKIKQNNGVYILHTIMNLLG